MSTCGAGFAQVGGEEARLAGGGRRSEPVQVEDAVHFLGARWDRRVRGGDSVNLMSASALKRLEGRVAVEVFGDQLAIDEVAVDDGDRREVAVGGTDVIDGGFVAGGWGWAAALCRRGV